MFKKLLAMGACVLPVLAVLLAPTLASAHTGGTARVGIAASVPGQESGKMEGDKETMEGDAGMMGPGVPSTGALDQEQSGGKMEGEKMDGQSGMMEGDQTMMGGGNLPATGSGDTTAWSLLAALATFLLATGATLKLAHARR